MNPGIEIRLLRRTDDVSGFRCGNAQLDRFIQHYARQNQFKYHVSTTWVAVSAGHVLGYATVTVATVERSTHPNEKLRKRLPGYPLPVLRLARLGVDEGARGLGLGERLMRHVFLLALEQARQVGCLGVLVDAKPDALGFYERLGFLALNQIEEGVLHGDSTPMFLPLADLEAAVASDSDSLA